MKKKDVFVIIAILFVVSVFTINLENSLYLEMSYKSDGGNVQVFYSSDDEYYNGENSIYGTLLKTQNEYDKIYLQLPPEKLTNLRIDFDNVKQISIDSIRLILFGIPIEELSGKQLVSTFFPNDDILISTGDNCFEATIVGDDSSILTNYNYWNLKYIDKNTKVIAFILFIILLILYKISRKYVMKIEKFTFLLIDFFVAIYFIGTNIVFTFDSVGYFGYLDYFTGEKLITQWNSIRGFVFPTILHLSSVIYKDNKILGLNIIMLIQFFVFYKITIFLIEKYAIGKKYEELASKNKILLRLFLVILIALNPIMISWFHLVLTESTTVMLLVIVIFVSHKNFNVLISEEEVNKSKVIINVLFQSIALILFWFLKQMYITIPLVIFFGYEVFLIFRKKSFRQVIKSVLILTMSCIILITSIITFDMITNDSKSSKSKFSTSGIIITGLRYFQINEGDFDFGSPNTIKYNEDNIVNVKDDEYRTIETFVYKFEDTFENKLSYWSKCFIIAPRRVIVGYIDNYLTISGFYSNPFREKINYSFSAIIKEFNYSYLIGRVPTLAGENARLGIATLNSTYSSGQIFDSIMKTNPTLYTKNVDNYNFVQKKNIYQGTIYKDWYRGIFHFHFMILMILIVPILFVYAFLYFKKWTLGFENEYTLGLVLVVFSFLHMIVLSCGGAIIDRYALPVYVAMIIVSMDVFAKIWKMLK